MSDHPSSVVIIGAGLAGVSCADNLRALGYRGPIDLYDIERRAPYDRPPLSKAALRGAAWENEAELRSPDHFAARDLNVHTGVKVKAIHPDSGRVDLVDASSVSADRIVLATGGWARRLGIAGEALAGVHVLRTADDAFAFHAAARAARRLVVIGGGLIGLEAAASLSRRGLHITILETAPRLLPRLFSASMSDFVAERHALAGHDIQLDCAVSGILGQGRVEAVELMSGQIVPADLVLIAVGGNANTGLAEAAGLELFAGGIRCDARMQTSHPRVLAIGDAATAFNGFYGQYRRMQHWRAAQTQAAVAASTLLGGSLEYAEPTWCWSDQFNWRVEAAGDFEAADEIVRRGNSGKFIEIFLKNKQVIGAASLNCASDMRSALKLIERRAICDTAVLGDPAQDLRRIAKAA